MSSKHQQRVAQTSNTDTQYKNFDRINGQHPLRDYCKDAYIDYRSRVRAEGKVFYFNFHLAKEMGLIPRSHPYSLNRSLEERIIETFSLQIINEYDITNGVCFDAKTIKPYPYMATRYLQLQHKDKRGLTSGDGRSMWNGWYSENGTSWDVSSCGTGTTRLSPAAQGGKVMIKTGDPDVSYGNGLASPDDGLMAAIMSEIYYHSEVPTERTLAIITYPDGSSVNVRAGKNLIRPAHMFNHLKQGNLESLKQVADHYIDREIQNGTIAPPKSRQDRYKKMLEKVTHDFAKVAALFETDYIFCWMDWDGDNILMDGGIIDYGSIRQFGLFHQEYRYDDVETFSTNITEQRNKARYIVQTFAQLVDFIKSKQRKPLQSFQHSDSTLQFDRLFDHYRNYYTLRKVGFSDRIIEKALHKPSFVKHTQNLMSSLRYFEAAKSETGLYEVTDGVTWDAIFSVRDFLREYPIFMSDGTDLSDDQIIEIMRSDYATDEDVLISPYRKQKIDELKSSYNAVISSAAEIMSCGREKILNEVIERSTLINRAERLTGDGLIHTANHIINNKDALSSEQLYELLRYFIDHETLNPDYNPQFKERDDAKIPSSIARIFNKLTSLVESHRETI